MNPQNLFWIGLVGAALALLFALFQSRKVLRFSEGTDLMQKIAASIRKGANAYLKRQYKTVVKFFLVMVIILAILAAVNFVSPFVPFAFVVGILLTTVLACFGIWQLAALMWGLYALLAIAMTVACVRDENWNATSVALPFLFLLLHVSYGVGTVVGLVRLPFWKKRHHNGVSPSIGEVRAAINGKKAAGERG